MSLYLDASAMLPRIVEEQTSDSVDAFLNACVDPLLTSELGATEVASAMSRLVRMGQITSAQGLDRLTAFDSWREAAIQTVALEPADFRLANVYVRRFDLKLRAPDALHVAICFRHGLTLVTLDRRLVAAAQSLGVTARMPVP